ncbi:VID27-like protein isoform X2 [Cloeon dipterum]
MLDIFTTLQDSLQSLTDDSLNRIENTELDNEILKLTDIAEDLLSMSVEESGGQSGDLTTEGTIVDIMKTIEDILQYFDDDPDVAENNPEDLAAIVDVVEEILSYLDGNNGSEDDKSNTKRKTTTEEPEEEETKKPKKKPIDEADYEEEDTTPKKKKTTPSDDEEDLTTKKKTTTAQEPETEAKKVATLPPTTTAAVKATTESKVNADEEEEGKPSSGKNVSIDTVLAVSKRLKNLYFRTIMVN